MAAFPNCDQMNHLCVLPINVVTQALDNLTHNKWQFIEPNYITKNFVYQNTCQNLLDYPKVSFWGVGYHTFTVINIKIHCIHYFLTHIEKIITFWTGSITRNTLFIPNIWGFVGAALFNTVAIVFKEMTWWERKIKVEHLNLTLLRQKIT